MFYMFIQVSLFPRYLYKKILITHKQWQMGQGLGCNFRVTMGLYIATSAHFVIIKLQMFVTTLSHTQVVQDNRVVIQVWVQRVLLMSQVSQEYRGFDAYLWLSLKLFRYQKEVVEVPVVSLVFDLHISPNLLTCVLGWLENLKEYAVLHHVYQLPLLHSEETNSY